MSCRLLLCLLYIASIFFFLLQPLTYACPLELDLNFCRPYSKIAPVNSGSCDLQQAGSEADTETGGRSREPHRHRSQPTAQPGKAPRSSRVRSSLPPDRPDTPSPKRDKGVDRRNPQHHPQQRRNRQSNQTSEVDSFAMAMAKNFGADDDVMEVDSPTQSLKRLLAEKAKNQTKGSASGKRNRNRAVTAPPSSSQLKQSPKLRYILPSPPQIQS